jgi:hypothetical protein
VHMIVLGLKERYQPVDMVSMVEMRQAINKMTMKKDDEPTILFDQITAISNRFRNTTVAWTDAEKIATVLSAAHVDYVQVLTAEQRVKGSKLRVLDLQETMMAQ